MIRSRKMLKRVGDRGHSFLTPTIVLNHSPMLGDRGHPFLTPTVVLVVNPVEVNSFAFLFNCTTVGRTSDGMKVPS